MEKTMTPASFQTMSSKVLDPLMQAFHVDSENAAHTLIAEAARAIYGYDQMDLDLFSKKYISSEEIAGITSLIKGIDPQDSLETLYAAQIVATHMLGMKRLSSSRHDDQNFGLKLLRFSSEILQRLDKKRKGSSQNITVNYIYQGSRPSGSEIVLSKEG